MLFEFAAFNDKENKVSFDKETKIIYHKQFKYNKKWEGKTMSTYWCANCKSSKSKCSSKIKVDFFGKVIKESGSHDVECTIKNKNSRQALQQLQGSNGKKPKLEEIDYTSFMKKRTDEIAIVVASKVKPFLSEPWRRGPVIAPAAAALLPPRRRRRTR